MSYNGWMIPDAAREALLARYAPSFPIVKASHVTHEIDPSDEFLPNASIVIVGWTYDETGLEAYVVEVNGSIFRPDGLVYHLTYSMVDGRASKESNDVIARLGYTPLLVKEPIETQSFFQRGDGPYLTTALTQ